MQRRGDELWMLRMLLSLVSSQQGLVSPQRLGRRRQQQLMRSPKWELVQAWAARRKAGQYVVVWLAQRRQRVRVWTRQQRLL